MPLRRSSPRSVSQLARPHRRRRRRRRRPSSSPAWWPKWPALATAYALRAGVLFPPIRPGTRIRVVGVIDPAQDCPGRVLIRADGGVTMLAPPPSPRRTRDTTIPK
jgi:hypothetical protein